MTFESIFFNSKSVDLRVPDYQRAYAWEKEQIDLFIKDLEEYQKTEPDYYFGHFIVEETKNEPWEIVDGQQRITTFVLFLMACRTIDSLGEHASAYTMINRFSTVSYDNEALKTIRNNLGSFFETNGHFDEQNPPPDQQIIDNLTLKKESFTLSQRRMVFTLLRFYQAFVKGILDRAKIKGYIEVVMKANCSLHRAKSKSVAVNIFEMHNTRGVKLTTLEIVKAKLMKFVYDRGKDQEDSDAKVRLIQDEFGEISRMEEQLAACSFRGEMSMDRLLLLHLRVVNDGTKLNDQDLNQPALNASADNIIEYVDLSLRYRDGDKKKTDKSNEEGVEYAVNLAKELKKSVRIISEILPSWDNDEDEDKRDSLVGDVLILERDLSSQFFLIVCRHLESAQGIADGRIGKDTLLLWEKLLFTRDFHEKYFYQGRRDNFPALFESLRPVKGREEPVTVRENTIRKVIEKYWKDGFRDWNETKGLQSIVKKYLEDNRDAILTKAFGWWRHKMIYALYKYEVWMDPKILKEMREVMSSNYSVEHILPQGWTWLKDTNEDLKVLPEDKWVSFHKEVEDCIDGIGNLLLISKSDNSSLGKDNPANKEYQISGGSYEIHNQNRQEWINSGNWLKLIRERGEKIFNFMVGPLIDYSKGAES